MILKKQQPGRAVGDYYGNIEVGEILEGSSGARAVVQRRRIITDRIGQYRGTFFIPKPQGDDVTTMPIGLNGSQSTNPRWATGTRTMRFTTNEDDSRTPGSVASAAQTEYVASETKTNTVREYPFN